MALTSFFDGNRVAGATTYYRLEENGSISVRQGKPDPYCFVRYADSEIPVLGAIQLFTYPDGGVWFQDGKHEFYEVGWDNFARPIDWDTHEKRRKASRGYSPADYR